MKPRLLLNAIGVPATALVACVAPLWTYAISLALFGLPHVATELRYVDQRFGARLRSSTALWLALGLSVIAVLRLAGIAGLGSGDQRAAVELVIGAVLVAAVIPVLAARGIAFALAGATLTAAGTLAAWFAPLDAIILLALLHNLTPVGFLAERLEGAARRRAMLLCALVFGVIPSLIVTGVPADLCANLGLPPIESGPPRVGDLGLHLSAFVPATLRGDQLGLDLFRAAAFLQCMHYAVVLHLLPRLGGGTERDGARLHWPKSTVFWRLVIASGGLFLCLFALSFAQTRSLYGVFAAVHAWIEIPILLLACAARPVRAIPMAAP